MPGAGWTKVGTSGDRNYSEEGVQVQHIQKTETARPAGATGPVAAFRTEEELIIDVTLWDCSLEQYRVALNGVAVTTVAAGVGVPGTKKMGLSMGLDVTTYALLARGPSAYGEGYLAQYEVPRVYQSGSAKPAYRKGKPVGIGLEFTALEDLTTVISSERFGRLIDQHQAAL